MLDFDIPAGPKRKKGVNNLLRNRRPDRGTAALGPGGGGRYSIVTLDVEMTRKHKLKHCASARKKKDKEIEADPDLNKRLGLSTRQAHADLIVDVREYVLDLVRRSFLDHVNHCVGPRLVMCRDWVKRPPGEDEADRDNHMLSQYAQATLLGNMLHLAQMTVAANALAKMCVNGNVADAQIQVRDGLEGGVHLLLAQDRSLVDIVHALTKKARRRIFRTVLNMDMSPNNQVDMLCDKLTDLVDAETDRAFSESANARGLDHSSIADVPEFETMKNHTKKCAKKIWGNVRGILAKNQQDKGGATPRGSYSGKREPVDVDVADIKPQDRLLMRLLMLNSSISSIDTILYPPPDSNETWRRSLTPRPLRKTIAPHFVPQNA